MGICSDNIHESATSHTLEELLTSAVVETMGRQSVDNGAAEATVSEFFRSASRPRQPPVTLLS